MSPPYYFRIDYMREHPNHRPCVDAAGKWYPPKSLGGNQPIGGGVSGKYWYCDGATIMEVAYLPQDYQHFKTFSVYYDKGTFWASRCDATAVTVGDGDDETVDDNTEEDAPEGGSEGWHHLSFDYEDEDEEQSYSSHITNAGQHDRLRTQRPDQIWPRMLLPEHYHAPESSRTTYERYGGLTGELPLFLALIAFSVDAKDVEWVLRNCFINYCWVPHNTNHVREDGRGMVVRVYLVPGRDAIELENYENGVWGKYFN